MTLRLYSTAEKVAIIDGIIDSLRRSQANDADVERLAVLKSIASDLRGRLDGAPNVALYQLERRLSAVLRARARNDSQVNSMIGVAEELIGRWPTVKQSLERFGAALESGK